VAQRGPPSLDVVGLNQSALMVNINIVPDSLLSQRRFDGRAACLAVMANPLTPCLPRACSASRYAVMVYADTGFVRSAVALVW